MKKLDIYISRCNPISCTVKETCLRFTSEPSEKASLLEPFTHQNGSCAAFIKNSLDKPIKKHAAPQKSDVEKRITKNERDRVRGREKRNRIRDEKAANGTLRKVGKQPNPNNMKAYLEMLKLRVEDETLDMKQALKIACDKVAGSNYKTIYSSSRKFKVLAEKYQP